MCCRRLKGGGDAFAQPHYSVYVSHRVFGGKTEIVASRLIFSVYSLGECFMFRLLRVVGNRLRRADSNLVQDGCLQAELAGIRQFERLLPRGT